MLKRRAWAAAIGLLLLLSACSATPASEQVAEAPPTTTQAQPSVPVEPVTAFAEPEEVERGPIDFTFTQALSDTLPPLTFRMIGEAYGEFPDTGKPRVAVEYLYVSWAEAAPFQEINVDGHPRDALERNRYGLVFDDYNGDGYLDMAIRRFPGESSNDRTHHYWLWDSDAQQFAYDWRLSEVVTDDNLIDFSVTQSIHDTLPPFTFRLWGRWVEGWSSAAQSTAENMDASIHVLEVMGSDGSVLQRFDRLGTETPRSTPSFGLHLDDYNFDGYLDLALYLSRGGSMHNRPHLYWLWDCELGQFVENTELGDLSNWSTVNIDAEKKQLECYTRWGAGSGIVQCFEYIEGHYVLVFFREWDTEPDPDKEGEYVVYEIVGKLIDGQMVETTTYDSLTD